MTRYILIILLCSCLLPIPFIHAQQIEGRISDYQTRRPLAFVNIVYTSAEKGTVSNIDGEFRIASMDEVEFLKFSYLGYHTKHIPLEEIHTGKPLQVRLDKKTYDI